jgi:hypothetical protein
LILKIVFFKEVWRKISIPNTFTLEDLADIIINLFELDSEHLHKFIYRDPVCRIFEFYHPEMQFSSFDEDNLSYSNIYRLGDLSLKIGQHLDLIHDFGDNLQFSINIEEIKPLLSKNQDFQLLESFGEIPEEEDYDDDDFYN